MTLMTELLTVLIFSNDVVCLYELDDAVDVVPSSPNFCILTAYVMKSYICSKYLGPDIMSFDEYFRIDLLSAST